MQGEVLLGDTLYLASVDILKLIDDVRRYKGDVLETEDSTSRLLHVGAVRSKKDDNTKGKDGEDTYKYCRHKVSL